MKGETNIEKKKSQSSMDTSRVHFSVVKFQII